MKKPVFWVSRLDVGVIRFDVRVSRLDLEAKTWDNIIKNMAIKYFKFKTKVSVNGVSVDKYVARMQVETKIDFDKMSEIIEKRSTVSKGDIMAVLSELESSAAWMLEEGHPVTLGIFGTFYPTLEATAVDTPEEVTNDTIIKFKTIFKPSKFLKKRFKNIDFILGDNKVREVNYSKNI